MANAYLSWRLSIALSLVALSAHGLVAQQQDTLGKPITQTVPSIAPSQQKSDPEDTDKEKAKKKKKKEHRGSFVVAPIPISNPALGSGLVPVVGYIFPISKNDKISPPSVVGGGGLITNNGSRALAAAAQLYFKENTYRSTAFYGRGNLNYNLYGSGVLSGLKLPLKQTGEVFQAEFLRRVAWKLFVGPRFMTGDSVIVVNSDNENLPVPPPNDLGLHTRLTALGVHLMRDTSPNRFYPISGSYFTLTSDFFSEALGSKYDFQSYRGSLSQYWSWGENHVLAFNGYGCATGGKPPFYGNCIYGSNNNLRGYVAGKYFDRYMVTMQLEYRLALPFRLGIVGFGGVGEAIPGNDQILFRTNNFLPAGGGGLRFLLSKAYHVNLRADYAWGNSGNETFSLGIGEAF